MNMKVSQLREIAERILSYTEGCNDNDIVITSPNNYGMDLPYIVTYEGFVSIRDIQIEEADNEY